MKSGAAIKSPFVRKELNLGVGSLPVSHVPTNLHPCSGRVTSYGFGMMQIQVRGDACASRRAVCNGDPSTFAQPGPDLGGDGLWSIPVGGRLGCLERSRLLPTCIRRTAYVKSADEVRLHQSERVSDEGSTPPCASSRSMSTDFRTLWWRMTLSSCLV